MSTSFNIGFKFQFGNNIIYEIIEINKSSNYHKCKQISNDNDWPSYIFLDENQLNYVSIPSSSIPLDEVILFIILYVLSYYVYSIIILAHFFFV